MYHIEFVVVNINKPNRRKNQKINYSNNLLVKLVMQCGKGLINGR